MDTNNVTTTNVAGNFKACTLMLSDIADNMFTWMTLCMYNL